MECHKELVSPPNVVAKSFGDYLTNQYEILVRTLSFLNIEDLTRAAYVCKSWNEAVNHIFRKRDKKNRFHWHTRSNQNCSLRETCFNDGIFFRSLSVIGFELPKYKHWLWRELLTPKFVPNKSSVCSDDDEDCEFVVPGVLGNVFSIVADVLIAPNNEGVLKHSRNQAAAVFFPKIDGFSLKTVLYNGDSNLASTVRSLLHDDDDNPLKGLLIFDRGIDREENIAQKLFNCFVHAIPSQPFAIAGGLFKAVEKFDRTQWTGNFDAALYAFYGNNIECYADLLQGQHPTDVEKFIKNIRKNLPPIDTGKQQRIAFIIRCVGRKNGKFETELFFKYFPDTPAFVILSYGEFAYRSNTGKYVPEKQFKMDNVEIAYAFSTVYFFITINLPS